MEFQRWQPRYRRIAETLGLSEEEDQKATFILSNLILGKTLELGVLRQKVSKKAVIVFGAGPSLDEDLRNLREGGFPGRCITVAANGATTALLNAEVVPSIVVTDLDGRIGDIVEAQRLGAVVVVHAHGDNIPALQSYVPLLYGRLLGTTQVRPVAGVHNFGGFTDGDRCVFLSEDFGAEKIILAGMDFGTLVGKHSKPPLESSCEATPLKRKKLEIAKQLLEWLSTWSRAELLNVTASGEEVRGFRKITHRELVNWGCGYG